MTHQHTTQIDLSYQSLDHLPRQNLTKMYIDIQLKSAWEELLPSMLDMCMEVSLSDLCSLR